MRKNLIVLVLAFAMIFSFAACGRTEPDTTEPAPVATEESDKEVTTEEKEETEKPVSERMMNGTYIEIAREHNGEHVAEGDYKPLQYIFSEDGTVEEQYWMLNLETNEWEELTDNDIEYYIQDGILYLVFHRNGGWTDRCPISDNDNAFIRQHANVVFHLEKQ